MSKVPPQFSELLLVLLQGPRALAVCHDADSPTPVVRRAVSRICGRLVMLCGLKITATAELLYPAPPAREHLLPVREDLVQGLAEVRRVLRKLTPDLFDEFLVALLDLL